MTPANNPDLVCMRRRKSSLERKHHVTSACTLFAFAFCAFAFCLAASISAPAQGFQTLVVFDGKNGLGPNSLAIGQDGNLYGTTQFGGSHSFGTVFKVTPAGDLTTLYNFCQLPNCADGEDAYAGLTLGPDGNFYSITAGGGSNNTDEGTVYQITPEGKLTTLYNFCSQTNCADGGGPAAGLTLAKNGTFYGTTLCCGANRTGTIFNITTAGSLTTLYNFCVISDCLTGEYSVYAPLIQATDGNLYGAALGGGAYGCGTVFRVTPAGKVTILHSFDNTDGCMPYGGLLEARDGSLYGTTSAGSLGYGTIFTISKGNQFKTLHSFHFSDGANPMATLIEGANGSLFGTSYAGGIYGWGTVFEFSPAGVLTVLHSFANSTDGADVGASLVQDSNGDLYGTAGNGGDLNCDQSLGCGTVFKLTP
jgi:uncharacterized repeat protein (TIGR03803 family)